MDIGTFLSLLRYYLSIYWPEQLDPSLKPVDSSQCLECRNITFDFIIVGAGSSGCVLANRLSANPKWKVLLIEAGGDEDYFTDTPGVSNALVNSDHVWNYTTTQQTICADQNGYCKFPRGFGMGGTSSVDEMLYFRGHPASFDEWAAMGNPGWNFNNVLPYFKRSENMTIPDFVSDTYYHSTSGPLTVAYPLTNSTLGIAYYTAAVYEYGVESIDYNNGRHVGSNYIQATLKGPTRCSASKAFLDPIRTRKNLYIFKRTRVRQVILSNGNNKRAIGVVCVTKGKEYQVMASKEVIISAGGIESPKLLMLSGIGPRQHLEELGIPVQLDLPVGHHLYDTPAVDMFFKANATELQYNDEKYKQAIKEYAIYRRGVLCAPRWKNIAPLNTTAPFDRNTLPNILFLDTLSVPPFTSDSDYPAMETILLLVSPASKGTLRLQSSNYLDQPLINPNYFHELIDLEIIEQALNIEDTYFRTSDLRRFSPQVILPPECGDFPGNFTIEYTRCYVKYRTNAAYGPQGTVKMGPESDPTSVVDSTLKVHKVDGLRVVDASIFPSTIRAILLTTEFMIAEKISDLILYTYLSTPAG